MFNSFYLYKFLQAGGDCFSKMVIISEGLVNIDATDRYRRWFYQEYEALFSFMIDRFPFFFFYFQEKNNSVIFHINLYFFCGCANFYKKMESPPAKFESFGLCIPAILWS